MAFRASSTTWGIKSVTSAPSWHFSLNSCGFGFGMNRCPKCLAFVSACSDAVCMAVCRMALLLAQTHTIAPRVSRRFYRVRAPRGCAQTRAASTPKLPFSGASTREFKRNTTPKLRAQKHRSRMSTTQSHYCTCKPTTYGHGRGQPARWDVMRATGKSGSRAARRICTSFRQHWPAGWGGRRACSLRDGLRWGRQRVLGAAGDSSGRGCHADTPSAPWRCQCSANAALRR